MPILRRFDFSRRQVPLPIPHNLSNGCGRTDARACSLGQALRAASDRIGAEEQVVSWAVLVSERWAPPNTAGLASPSAHGMPKRIDLHDTSRVVWPFKKPAENRCRKHAEILAIRAAPSIFGYHLVVNGSPSIMAKPKPIGRNPKEEG
jgi:hypothetical protein